jgi:hypothetical protein
MGRLGAKTVTGSYNAELTVGGATDLLFESLTRNAWATATSIPFASVTTVAITTNQLTCGAGSSWITAGIRVGDIFTLASTSVAADNGLNVPVVAVTTGTIVVPDGTFSTLSAASTGTLTILKKLKQSTTPTSFSHTIEQLYSDITKSEQFIGCRLTGIHVSLRSGQVASLQYTFAGLNRVTGTVAYFSSPSLTTGLPLIADDGAIRMNGAPVASFEGLDLNFQIASKVPGVIGSFTASDVILNDISITGTITATRSDFGNLTLFDAETEFEIMVKLEEPNTGPPKSCFNLFLPRVKIAGVSAPILGDGELVETLPLMIGPKASATGYDATAFTVSSSAP